MAESFGKNFFWPDVSSIENAKKAAGYGVGAAIFVAIVTAGLATWALIAQKTVVGFVDAWAYVDAVVFFAIAFGIYKESRFAAIAGLVLYVFEKWFQLQVTGELKGAVLAIFMIMFFISSVRGTYALRRLRAQVSDQSTAAGDGVPYPDDSSSQ